MPLHPTRLLSLLGSKSTNSVDANRQYAHERLLARLAHADVDQWVLKGGTAMALRVPGTRATKDLDILAYSAEINEAIEKFQNALAVDLDDFVEYTIAGVLEQPTLDNQSYGEGRRIRVQARIANKKKLFVLIDLVVGTVITAPADSVIISGLVEDLDDFSFPLYSVPDQIADKVCATQATYRGLPSSRAKDLFDIVVLASIVPIEGGALTEAIRREWIARSLPQPMVFTPPVEFGTQYTTYRQESASKGLIVPPFELGVRLALRLVGPALNNDAVGKRWSPSRSEWI